MDKGSWAIFELPGFASAAVGAPQDSLDALRAAKTTSYFKDKTSLWVKLVVEDAVPKGPVVVQVGTLRAQASIDVNKQTAVASASR
jgi:cell migration-inducing and hyaluronan-binding protein